MFLKKGVKQMGSIGSGTSSSNAVNQSFKTVEQKLLNQSGRPGIRDALAYLQHPSSYMRGDIRAENYALYNSASNENGIRLSTRVAEQLRSRTDMVMSKAEGGEYWFEWAIRRTGR